MSNGDDTQNNCVLEVCCGGNDGKQEKALAERLQQYVAGINAKEAQAVAAWLVTQYDFAPKGSLVAFKTAIAHYARGFPYE